MSERLHVIRDDVLVGVLDRGDDERLQFTFSEHAVDVAEGNVLVSASLPVPAALLGRRAAALL